MIEVGQMVRVTRLGKSGYELKQPAYAKVMAPASDERTGQFLLNFLVMGAMDQDEGGDIGFRPGRFSAAPHFLLPLSNDEQLKVLTIVALMGGGSLVITSEPVTVSNSSEGEG